MLNLPHEPGEGLVGVSEEEYLPCTRCGLCSYTCPTYRVLLSQAQSPRGRVALMRAIHQGEALVGDGFASKILRCTLCAACTQVCPSGVLVDNLLIRAREELARQDRLPPGLTHLSQNLSTTHNISGEDNILRLIWTENLAHPPQGVNRSQAEVVYFVGCVSSFFPQSFRIPQTTVQLLEAAGVEYALLGGEEWCCGYPLLANGSWRQAREAVLHNVDRVRLTGASSLVFTCPSCYHVWKHEYPRIAGVELEGMAVWHISEFLADLIAQGQLPLRELDEVVTYHDPCDLGRKSQVVEAPRQVLRSIPGLTLVEMRETRESALCCGGGGNLETYDPELVLAASSRRLAQALETGAQTIVSACQQCERTLAHAVRRQKARLRVLDITEIVAQAVER
ncbi:MAG: (Fe-S)-binding protein [Anaerolineae bacterium]